MIKFKNYFEMLVSSTKSKNLDYISNCGERFLTSYEYDIIDGIKTLVPNGETDLQAEIDSFAELQDINNIIARFVNGDRSAINPNNGVYGDFSNVPTTYAELFSRVQHCKNVFDKMPVELREKFDNSYEKFWSDFGSDSFDEIFKEYNSKFGKQSEGGVPESTSAVSGEDKKGADVDAK